MKILCCFQETIFTYKAKDLVAWLNRSLGAFTSGHKNTLKCSFNSNLASYS